MNQEIQNRVKWFQQDRFGMFIHWGLYAIPGRGEWLRSTERLSIEDYQKYFDEFDPIKCDPIKWALAAKNAGMKYIVFTAKHHDGFCLFDSKFTDYKITNTRYHKDVLREYVEAVREVGLKVGVYFSLIDWHHPDYPKFNDWHHPMRQNPAFQDEEIDFENYIKFMHGQIEEIVSQYGKLDILWFDFSYDTMRNETWKAEELMEMVRQYQPDVIVDNRLETSGEGYGSIITSNPTNYSGDFISPEHIVPNTGILDENGVEVPWELCTTLNNNWGYSPYDREYKSAKFVIRKLVECVSKGGNLLVNVAPTALGNFNRQSLNILNEIGEWMEDYGESIYGCGNAHLPRPDWGFYTKKNHVIYGHIFDAPLGVLALPGIKKEQIHSVRRVIDGTEVKLSKSWTTLAFSDMTFVELGHQHLTMPLENDISTVIKITLKEEV